MEVCQISKELLAEASLGAQEFNILSIKMKIFNILNQLFQAGKDGITAAIGHLAEKNIKISNLILVASDKIAIGHRQLVKIAEQ